MDPRGAVEIDQMVGEWRHRMMPSDSQLRRETLNDPYHAAMLEHIRRLCHVYDRAMELEGIGSDTRERVLSMVLLGDPSGLENLAAHRVEELYKRATQELVWPRWNTNEGRV